MAYGLAYRILITGIYCVYSCSINSRSSMFSTTKEELIRGLLQLRPLPDLYLVQYITSTTKSPSHPTFPDAKLLQEISREIYPPPPTPSINTHRRNKKLVTLSNDPHSPPLPYPGNSRIELDSWNPIDLLAPSLAPFNPHLFLG
ncbi:hypothetical protein L873DRAFT_947448 [Choiromyces venosus 120613-1]|uniref:Uncharacterized protein n=1 Tax=Choiromyces venosus 120613-1 TaxID=1336337 RepID=A0A3N4K3I3_9PEZI|nr:hypothetical protein L873DRAFT_947448 [Choiromyces venosus 120613-1]